MWSWCCCRVRKITEALDECILTLKADNRIYRDVDSYISETETETETEASETLEEFQRNSTLSVHVINTNTHEELNFMVAVPIQLCKALTSSIEEFMADFNKNTDNIFLARFDNKDKYGTVECLRESRDKNGAKIFILSPFPPRFLNFLLKNTITIILNKEGLKCNFQFKHHSIL